MHILFKNGLSPSVPVKQTNKNNIFYKYLPGKPEQIIVLSFQGHNRSFLRPYYPPQQ